MGQTLENGVYLPSEGERNCYAGLKTNWEILDQKIADVTALQQAVAGALHRQIVASLPTTDIDPNTIYMILSGTSATENVYNEFMYVNNAWELIGTSATDLTNYYTKAEVDGKLLLKANASDLTSHTGDTTIHVTTADKNRWNNQTYVFRYSSTALTASSTNSNALLDNTDNLKVGDKVIDSSGVLFSITAIDTQNSTFTIGTALIDLAQDSDVVHRTGDETIAGAKTFTGVITNNITNKVNAYITLKNSLYDPKTNGQSNANSGSFSISFDTLTDDSFAWISAYGLPDCTMLRLTTAYFTDSENSITDSIEYKIYQNGDRSLRPRNNNNCMLGETSRKWSKIYGTEYYYGSNNVEFSTKFVTTDTAQTISGNKTFSSNVNVYNSDSATDTANIVLKNSKAEMGVESPEQSINFIDKNNNLLSKISCSIGSDSYTRLYITAYSSNNNPDGFFLRRTTSGTSIIPTTSSAVWLGNIIAPFYNVQTKKINTLEPSSLSLPSDRSARIDISSYFTNTGTGDKNTYTVPANGYIYMDVNDCVSLYMFSQTTGNLSNYGNSICRNAVGRVIGFLPVRKDDVFTSQWYTSATNVTLASAFFIPCQGNV